MLAGVILAGGKSSRMGSNKSLLKMPESQLSLVEHGQKQLSLVCESSVFISGSDHEQGIDDVIPNCGPLSGIHGAITHFEMYHPSINELLVTAVDMPDLSPDDLNYLLKTGRKNCCLCSFENCFLPVYIPLSIKITQYLGAVLVHECDESSLQVKKRKYSIKMMFESLKGVQIPRLKNTQLNNINTPAQWQQRCTGLAISKAKQ